MEKEIVIFNGRFYSAKTMKGGIYHIATTDPRTRLSRDMWEFFKREKLKSTEIIHHINGNSLDDRMENFAKMEWGIHSSTHLTGIKRSKKTKYLISVGKSKLNPIRSKNIIGKNNPNWKGGHSNSYKYSKYRATSL